MLASVVISIFLANQGRCHRVLFLLAAALAFQLSWLGISRYGYSACWLGWYPAILLSTTIYPPISQRLSCYPNGSQLLLPITGTVDLPYPFALQIHQNSTKLSLTFRSSKSLREWCLVEEGAIFLQQTQDRVSRWLQFHSDFNG